MSKDRPQERPEKQTERDAQQEMRFDALDLMKEGAARGDRSVQAGAAEYAALLRDPERFAEAERKREEDFQSAMQALDRGDAGPAQRLVKKNDQDIAVARRVIANLQEQVEEKALLC
jgi:hypothetical protein